MIFKKTRTIFFNQKKKDVFHRRFLLIFFLSILIINYLIYESFLFVVRLPDDAMLPNYSPGDTLIFKAMNVDDEEVLNTIPVGSVIAFKHPDIPSPSIFIKILDFPVYFLTLGWVKLNHRKVVMGRLLAYSGDKLEIRNKVIYVNDKVFLPQWVIKYQDVQIFPETVTTRDNLSENYIEKNHFFVINDNWDRMRDSRALEQIKIEDIYGVMIYHFSSSPNP